MPKGQFISSSEFKEMVEKEEKVKLYNSFRLRVQARQSAIQGLPSNALAISLPKSCHNFRFISFAEVKLTAVLFSAFVS